MILTKDDKHTALHRTSFLTWVPHGAARATTLAPPMASCSGADSEITYTEYTGEHQLQGIIDLISVDLSEPYSIFTYRYFINNWPNLCFIATTPGKDGGAPQVVGTIVCKQDRHRSGAMRGYIAMLAVHHSMRKRGMGKELVRLAVCAMRDDGCDEAGTRQYMLDTYTRAHPMHAHRRSAHINIPYYHPLMRGAVLETEVTNLGALRLYEGLGFVRDKRLHRYYLNGNDAFRLKVWFHDLPVPDEQPSGEEQPSGSDGEDVSSPKDVGTQSAPAVEAD